MKKIVIPLVVILVVLFATGHYVIASSIIVAAAIVYTLIKWVLNMPNPTYYEEESIYDGKLMQKLIGQVENSNLPFLLLGKLLI